MSDAVFYKLAPVIVVTVTDAVCDRVLAEGDSEKTKELSVVAGPYFDTGYTCDGQPVWKSVPASSVWKDVDRHMYWFHQSGGWNLADTRFFGQKDEAWVQPRESCWAKSLDTSPSIPRTVHFSLWEKQTGTVSS